VRRVVKVAVWAGVFLGAAAIGAYVAAHTELFPPGVETGAAVPSTGGSPSPSGTPTPADPAWRGVIHSAGYHELYVGGRCTTHWLTRLSFHALGNGKVVGSGIARLDGDRECSFPNAQVNAERIEVSVVGEWDEAGFRIRLNDGERSPRGTADYGGFAPTVFEDRASAFMEVPLDADGAASATIRMERVDDQGRGSYVSVNRVSFTLEP
jgi:hypothetical protein